MKRVKTTFTAVAALLLIFTIGMKVGAYLQEMRIVEQCERHGRTGQVTTITELYCTPARNRDEQQWQKNQRYIAPGYYCAGSSSGKMVYAPGRQIDGQAWIIWAGTGRAHYLPITQLNECR